MVNWEEKWKCHDIPWDLGIAHPGTLKALNWLLEEGWVLEDKSVLLPLCGSALDAKPFLLKGADVFGVDLSNTAITVAQNNFSKLKNFNAIEADYLAYENAGFFDLIVDRAALCAIPPELRRDYIHKSISLLKPKGKYAFIAFDKITANVEGPPFSINAQEVAELFLPWFHLMRAEKVSVPSKTPAILEETLYIWEKID